MLRLLAVSRYREAILLTDIGDTEQSAMPHLEAAYRYVVVSGDIQSKMLESEKRK
jgi:hypothetical protein